MAQDQPDDPAVRQEEEMYRRFRDRFGTAGVVLAVIALVAALGGTAYAAKGALTGKQKKEVEKIAKKYAGKPGTPGANGSPGANGKDGTNGTNGTDGADGASVTGTPIAAGGACGVGVTGVKYTLNATSTNVCNGKDGEDGESGFTEVLPPEATETGAWAIGANELGEGTGSLSFAIPLADEIEAANLHIVSREAQEDEDVPAGCTVEGVEGSAASPLAQPGHLCIYVAEEESAFIFNATKAGTSPPAVGASTAGARLQRIGEEFEISNGTFAVTGDLP